MTATMSYFYIAFFVAASIATCTQATDTIFTEDQTYGGFTRIHNPNEHIDHVLRGSCSLASKYVGSVPKDKLMGLKTITELKPELVCQPNRLSGYVLIDLARNAYNTFADRHSWKADYPCIADENISADHWVPLAGILNLSAAVIGRGVPRGFLYTDKFYEPREEIANLSTAILECDLPAQWKRIASANATTMDITVEISDFEALFTSPFYHLMMRYLAGLAYLSVTLLILYYIREHFAVNAGKRFRAWPSMSHVQLCVLFMSLCNMSLLTWYFFYEGWWATGNTRSKTRDAFSSLFMGQAAACAPILAIQYAEFRKFISVSSYISRDPPSFLRAKCYILVVAAALFVVDCVFFYKTVSGGMYVHSERNIVAAVYGMILLVCALLFHVEFRRLHHFLFDAFIGDSNMNIKLQKQRRDLLRCSICMICVVASTMVMGLTSLPFAGPSQWFLCSAFYVYSRCAMTLSFVIISRTRSARRSSIGSAHSKTHNATNRVEIGSK